MPAGETVDLNGEKLDLIPISDLMHTVGERRNQTNESLAECGKTRRLDPAGEGTFCDDEATLEVIAAVDEDEQAAVVDVSQDIFRVAFMAAEVEP